MVDEYPFHLITRWRVPGRAETAFDLLSDQARISRWWPELYREVHEVVPGDEQGLGQALDILTRGRLPYGLRWRLSVVDVRRPERIEIAASGDLIGRGLWTLRQDGDFVDLTYDWRVGVGKPWLRPLQRLLRGFMAANHDWIMA